MGTGGTGLIYPQQRLCVIAAIGWPFDMSLSTFEYADPHLLMQTPHPLLLEISESDPSLAPNLGLLGSLGNLGYI